MSPCEDASRQSGTESLTFTIYSICRRYAVNRGLAATAVTAVVIAAGMVFGWFYVVQNAAIFKTNEPKPSHLAPSITPEMEQEPGAIEQLILSNPWAEALGTSIILHIQVKNSGTRPATIGDVLINGRPSAEYGSGARIILGDAPLGQTPINPGSQAKLTIYLSKSDVTSGQRLDLTVRTELGNEFPLHVVLP